MHVKRLVRCGSCGTIILKISQQRMNRLDQILEYTTQQGLSRFAFAAATGGNAQARGVSGRMRGADGSERKRLPVAVKAAWPSTRSARQMGAWRADQVSGWVKASAASCRRGWRTSVAPRNA